jgi:aspartate racemase
MLPGEDGFAQFEAAELPRYLPFRCIKQIHGKENQMARGKIGILGGMGTASGIHFAQKLIQLNGAARQDSEHASFILYSDPAIPSRVDAFMKQATNPADSIASSLQKLANLGADFGVVICNTAHIYYSEITNQVSLPLINMIDATATHIAQSFAGVKIGLLATEATVKSGLYARAFEMSRNVLVVPDAEGQELVSAAIFDPVFGVKSTGMSASARALENLRLAASRMREEHGVQHLLLGCTELSLSISDSNWNGFDVIDPVNILARTCLDRAGHMAAH